ncbi:MAG: hypothetical protein QM808_08770 [Steroidobacteraceae bacterium]
MNNEKQPLWFPAKRYGWGWGAPIRWQGWAVLLAFLVLVRVGIKWFAPQQRWLALALYLLVLSVGLIGICWMRGETPRWRWGQRR